MTARQRVFTRMWGVAVLAHLAGNWYHGDLAPDPTGVGIALTAAGLLATAALVAPRPWAMWGLSVVVPVTVVLEAPVLGNHWLLAGLVSLAFLAAGGRWERFEPAARWILVAFYGFAAFAKLNTGFLDPVTSCGLFYANQSLAELGLGPISPASVWGWAVSWGTALVELAVVPLLLWRRTRVWGVLLAVVFHGLISLDLAQHFFDFTAVLLPLFVSFLGLDHAGRFERVGRSVGSVLRRSAAAGAALVGTSITLASVTPANDVTAWFLQRGTFLWWIPYVAFVTWSVAVTTAPAPLRWRVTVPVGLVVGLVVLNGLTPYLEVKTAYGWNMYSNLVTAGGDSNHLLVGATWPVRDDQSRLVEIVSSEDPGLQVYAEEGYLLPWPSFATYVSEHPDQAVTYRMAGEEMTVEAAGDVPGVPDPIPWWWRWMPLRAIHADVPQECQPVFLPAL
jgi:hypothetical protein